MDFDFVRGASIGAVIGLVAAGLVVLLLVRSLFSKVVSLLVILALAGGVFYYRASLDDCVKTCSCKLASKHIQIYGHGCAAKR
jgi:hypothetical protein